MLDRLSNREKILLVLLLLVVSAAGFYRYVWVEYWSCYRQLYKSLQTEKGRLADAKNEIYSYSELSEQEKRLQSMLSDLKSQFFSDLNGGEPLREVGRNLKGVELRKVVPRSPVSHGSYSILQFQLEVEGSYASILSFIKSLESSPRIIKIDSLVLKRKNAADDGYAPITAELLVSFYGTSGGLQRESQNSLPTGREDIFKPVISKTAAVISRPGKIPNNDYNGTGINPTRYPENFSEGYFEGYFPSSSEKPFPKEGDIKKEKFIFVPYGFPWKERGGE